MSELQPWMERDGRPLRVLFLDLNAYFASVEQQENPDLRGRPIAVVPVMSEGSCVIAASYEAKRFGVSTGTLVREARRLCPEIAFVSSRTKAYAAYHERVLEAVDTVLPVEEVCSIDEMRFRLLGVEREPEMARRLALRLKAAIRERVGECMSCSIGIAPNSFLAKLGTELQKPDGLVLLTKDDLPHALHPLPLRGFTGINRRMEIRLNAAGIFNAEQLLAADRNHLRNAFGSIVGERWWYLLRGYEMPEETRRRKTLGHSHVLPPELRNEKGCREVLLRLIQKASARLRSTGLWAGTMDVGVRGTGKSWSAHIKLPPTHDTLALNDEFLRLWADHDFSRPQAVGVTFGDLQEAQEVTPSLFDDTGERAKLDGAVDSINRRFGKNKVFLAGMENARDSAPERIAFQKTTLFDEGESGDQ
jgi:DNA polymerase IV